jgi:hypothetical protein
MNLPGKSLFVLCIIVNLKDWLSIFALENQLSKLNSIESLHMTRSVNMQTRYCCIHNTCCLMIRHSENEKKSHCLKQTIRIRVQEKKERSRRMSNKLVCLQPCSIYIDVFLLKDRNHRKRNMRTLYNAYIYIS